MLTSFEETIKKNSGRINQLYDQLKDFNIQLQRQQEGIKTQHKVLLSRAARYQSDVLEQVTMIESMTHQRAELIAEATDPYELNVLSTKALNDLSLIGARARKALFSLESLQEELGSLQHSLLEAHR